MWLFRWMICKWIGGWMGLYVGMWMGLYVGK